MTRTWCLPCKKRTNDVDPKLNVTKNNKWLRKSRCGECNSNKCRFVPSRPTVVKQKGGALARHKPRLVDKIAEGASMFLAGPAPSFASLGMKLGTQSVKAASDIYNQYRKRS